VSTIVPVSVAILLSVFAVLWRRRALNNKPYLFSSDAMSDFLSDTCSGLSDADSLHAALIPTVPREIQRKHTRLLEVIGQGEFASVHKGLLNEKPTTGIPEFTVAVKVLRNEPTEREMKDFMREAAMVAQFQHPNVIALVGVCTAGSPAMLVMQYCEHGSLRSFLRSHTSFNELRLSSKVQILQDIAGGMTYLSERNVVHRDLAARNVLVGGDYVCKISDFGLSREVKVLGADYLATGRGVVPLRCTAP
jgi:serine/threonine protein kinase